MPFTTTPTAYAEGISRPALFRRLAIATGILQTGTVGAGSSNSVLKDETQLQSSQLDSEDWKGGWIRISSTTDGLAPVGEIAAIQDYLPEIGEIEPNPYFSASLDTGDTYELWRLNPHTIKELVDHVLTDVLVIPAWSVLSEVPDFDMEEAGVTHWTAGGSAVLTKATSSPVTFGQYLHVVSAAQDDYARTDLLGVAPGRSVYCGVAVRPGDGATVTLKLWDETNDVLIYSKSLSRRRLPVRIGFNKTVPQECLEVSLRLSLEEAGVEADFDDVIFFGQNSVDISAPPWVTHGDQIKAVFRLRGWGTETEVFDSSLQGEADSRFDKLPGRPFRIRARYGSLAEPLYIFATRHETAYADDTQLKYLDPDMFIACIKWKLNEMLTQPLIAGILDAEVARSKLATARGDYFLLRQAQDDEINKIITSPTPSGYFLDSRFRYGA